MVRAEHVGEDLGVPRRQRIATGSGRGGGGVDGQDTGDSLLL
jgi:hypothetical protein